MGRRYSTTIAARARLNCWTSWVRVPTRGVVGLVARSRPTSAAALLALIANGRSRRMIYAFRSANAPASVPLKGCSTALRRGARPLSSIVPEEIKVPRTDWTLVHADLRRVPRVRAVIRFLRRIARSALPAT